MSRSRRAAATAAGVVLFATVLIAAFGFVSLLLDEDVIVTPSLGQVPGVIAVGASLASMALTIWVRMPAPGVWGTLLWSGLAAFLGYLAGLGVASVFATADGVLALSAVGRAAATWRGLVVIAAAILGAAMALAIARGAGENARWPWERDDDE
ncbi:MAG: hypothetical protein BGO47_07335 [Microbacterium sp. 67-17]|uniref:hypothetical protein n=1 Tax=Microbacterium sp. 67-17 TaxID=1895782 RepID=UPI0009652805|nr:hypothetical protein [Microbacterium sp. 67-17]OJV98112.1 MAG: hypothetical protein BGO47_07335 [Microbacterium sp. 67-17]